MIATPKGAQGDGIICSAEAGVGKMFTNESSGCAAPRIMLGLVVATVWAASLRSPAGTASLQVGAVNP